MKWLIDAKLWLVALATGCLAVGCMAGTTEEGATRVGGAADGFFTEEGFGEESGVREPWDVHSDPANWRQQFEYNWERLSEYGEAASKIVPWPGDYWPMVRDGYNQRWQGRDQLSPAELYDKAFNGWVPPEGFMELRPFADPRRAYDAEYYESVGPFALWSHQRGGNYRGRQLWNPDGTLVDHIAEVCDRDGDNLIDLDAPVDRCDFDGDGTPGYGDDLGGLAGWFGHCHAWAPAAFSIAEPQHAVEHNGVRFEVSDLKALGEAMYEGGGSVFLGARCNAREVQRDDYGRIVQDECRDTNAGAFHVVIVNVVGRLGASFVADVTTNFEVWNHPVRGYRIRSQERIDERQALELLGRGDLERYADIVPERDRDATWERWQERLSGFVRVDMEFRYVVESGTSREPMVPDIDRYTRTKDYEYILELDAEGNIIGGEWISRNPPDFLWAPRHEGVDVRDSRYRTILSADNVRMLFEMAVGSEEPEEPTEPTEPTDCDPAYAEDTLEEAMASGEVVAPYGDPVAGRICEGDSDFYVIHPPPAHDVATVTISFSHAAGDLDLRSYSIEGESRPGSAGTGDTETVQGTGDFVVEVYGYGGATGDYTLTVE